MLSVTTILQAAAATITTDSNDYDIKTVDSAAIIAAFGSELDVANQDITTTDSGPYRTVDSDSLDVLHRVGDEIAAYEYVEDHFDCEDYAYLFKSLAAAELGVSAVAVVHNHRPDPAHAFNVIVDADGDLHRFEPQDNEFVSAEGDHRMDGDGWVLF